MKYSLFVSWGRHLKRVVYLSFVDRVISFTTHEYRKGTILIVGTMRKFSQSVTSFRAKRLRVLPEGTHTWIPLLQQNLLGKKKETRVCRASLTHTRKRNRTTPSTLCAMKRAPIRPPPCVVGGMLCRSEMGLGKVTRSSSCDSSDGQQPLPAPSAQVRRAITEPPVLNYADQNLTANGL